MLLADYSHHCKNRKEAHVSDACFNVCCGCSRLVLVIIHPFPQSSSLLLNPNCHLTLFAFSPAPALGFPTSPHRPHFSLNCFFFLRPGPWIHYLLSVNTFCTWGSNVVYFLEQLFNVNVYVHVLHMHINIYIKRLLIILIVKYVACWLFSSL